MKRSLLIAILGTMLFAQNSQAQYSAGYVPGMYPAMARCPYNQGMAQGAYSADDDVSPVKSELKAIPTEIKKLEAEKRKLDKTVEKLEAAIGGVVSSDWTDKVFSHMQDAYNCFCPSDADNMPQAPSAPPPSPAGGHPHGKPGSADRSAASYDFIDSGEFFAFTYPAAFESSVTDLPAGEPYHWVALNSSDENSNNNGAAVSRTALSRVGGGRMPATPDADSTPDVTTPPVKPHHRKKAVVAAITDATQPAGVQATVAVPAANPNPVPPPAVIVPAPAVTQTITVTTNTTVDNYGFLKGPAPVSSASHSKLCDTTNPPQDGWFQPNKPGGICKDGGNIDPHVCSVPGYQVSGGITQAQVADCQSWLKDLKRVFLAEKDVDDHIRALNDRKIHLDIADALGEDDDDAGHSLDKMEAGTGYRSHVQAPKTNWAEVLAGGALSAVGFLAGQHSEDGIKAWNTNQAKLGYNGVIPGSTFGAELTGLTAGAGLMTQGFAGGVYSGVNGGIGCAGSANGGGYQNGMYPMMNGYGQQGAFGYPQGFGNQNFGFPNNVSGGAFMPGSAGAYGVPFGNGLNGGLVNGSPFSNGLSAGGSPFGNPTAYGSPFVNGGGINGVPGIPGFNNGNGGIGPNYQSQMAQANLMSINAALVNAENQEYRDAGQIANLQAAAAAQVQQMNYGGFGSTGGYSSYPAFGGGYGSGYGGSPSYGNGFSLSAGLNFGSGTGGYYNPNSYYYTPSYFNSGGFSSPTSGTPFSLSGGAGSLNGR